MAEQIRFDAFISYSHGASGDLATGLQQWLQKYAKPFWRRRSIGVFRDETDLSASPGLWTSIAGALDQSEWLILVASPESAASKWVKREVRFWLGNSAPLEIPVPQLDQRIHSPSVERAKRILIVVAGGNVVWDDGNRPDFDWTKTDALPKCLSGVFEQEPFWLDLRDVASNASAIGSSNPQFMDAVARLSSRIRGKVLSDLIGEDALQHRRTRRLTVSALAAITTLAILASAVAWIAALSAEASDKQRRIAETEKQVAIAQSLLVRDPAQLPTSGHMAAEAFIGMEELAAYQVGPGWLSEILEWSGLSWVPAFRSLLDANAFRADSGQTREALIIVQTADTLLPRLLISTASGPQRSASDVTFQEDGSVAIAAFGNTVNVFSAESGEAVREVTTEIPANRINGRQNIAFSANGQVAALETSQGLIQVISMKDGAIRLTIDPHELFDDAAFQPAKLKNTSGGSGTVTESFNVGVESGTPLMAGLALNQGGDVLVLVTRGGQVQTFSLEDGLQPLGQLWTIQITEPGSIDRISELTLNETGDTMAVACSITQGTFAQVDVFSALDGHRTTAAPDQQRGALNAESMVNALAFESGSNLLAIGAEDGGISLWDITNGQRVRTIPTGSPVQSIAFGQQLAEGYLLAGTADGLARVFRTISGREVVRAPHQGRVDSVAWDASGSRFATGAVPMDSAEADTLRVWQFAPQEFQSSAPFDPKPSYSHIAVNGELVAAIEYPSGLAVWNSANGHLQRVFRVPPAPRLPFIIDAENNRAVTVASNEDGLAYEYNLLDGTSQVIVGPGLSVAPDVEKKRFIFDASFDIKGAVLARVIMPTVTEGQCRIEIWGLAFSNKLDDFACGGDSVAIATSPDGSTLAMLVPGADPYVSLRSISGQNVIWRTPLSFPLSNLVGKRLVFSTDGRAIGVAGKRNAQMLDSATGAEIGAEILYNSDVLDIALSESGGEIAASLANHTVLISDSATAAALRIFDYVSDTTGGGGLAFGNDGANLFANFGDGSFGARKLWSWSVDPKIMVKRLIDRVASYSKIYR